MRFTTPLALLLLLTIPAVLWTGWPGAGVRRARLGVAVLVRTLILLALIFAAAGMAIERQSNQLAVVFVVDLSDSVPPLAVEEAVDIILEASAALGPDDEMAVIVFGEDALVERALSNATAAVSFVSVPDRTNTDIEEAIRLAQAILPTDRAGRLVLISDLQETIGEGPIAARAAVSSGIEIVVYPIEPQLSEEVLVAQAQAPPHVIEGEIVELEITVWSSIAQAATIEIFTDGRPPQQHFINLSEGFGVYRLAAPPADPGFIRYTVQVSTVQDAYFQNNRWSAYSFISGGPQILVIAPEPGELMPAGTSRREDEFSALVQALEAGQYQVEVRQPGGVPSSPGELAGYAAVILIDVPARRLSAAQMGSLKTYVQEVGGGLLLVGGPTSFGIGGYFDTPLEEISPVAMQIQDEERRSALSIVFIIDKSGSMADRTAGFSKLDLAREATLRSIELLLPNDRLGVIAFDEAASWVVPLGPVGDGSAARQAVSGLAADGGTDILAGLSAMADSLPEDPALVKHVVLLTDGGADPTGILGLVERVRQDDNITISAVGVGSDAAPFLPEIAAAGGGRFHFSDPPSAIPSIFTEETVLASRAYLVEESFFPLLISRSPILGGINELPPLHGYVATSPKQVASLILAADNGDPILATWRTGLGKTAAFTSDATGRWARDWVAWEQYGTFWNQAVRWVLRTPAASRARLEVIPVGESSQIHIDATDESGEYLNGYAVRVRIIAPDQTVSTIELTQTGPGQYTGLFDPGLEGAYLMQVEGQPAAGPGQPLSETFGWVRDYSAEYRASLTSRSSSASFLGIPGVRMAPAAPSELFRHDLPAPRTLVPVQAWLLLAAALLLPIDIAVRRLDVDLPRLFTALGSRIKVVIPGDAASPVRERQPRFQALQRAKARATEDAHKAEQAPPDAAAEHATAPSETKEGAQLHDLAEANRPGDDQQASTAARLLAKKRSRNPDTQD